MAYSLKAVRKQAGLTQMEFANIAGVSAKTVSNWENGKSIIDVVSFCKLSELSNISVNDIKF